MSRFEREAFDSQTVFRAEQRLAFAMSQIGESARRAAFIIGAFKGNWKPPELWSRYTAGEKELRRDRSRFQRGPRS
jgi:hypothetical protein